MDGAGPSRRSLEETIRCHPFNETLLHIVDQYRAAGLPWPATAKQLASFALEEKLYEAHQGRLLSLVAEEFSRAMREQYIKDPQGRSVRAKHVARLVVEGEQKRLWDGIDTVRRLSDD